MHLNYKKVYFSGIGGIGVSALAKMFHGQGIEVVGSDVAKTEITKELEDLGIKVNYDQKSGNLVDDFNLFIYSPAVPATNPERKDAIKYKIEQKSYPEFLGELSLLYDTVAVSGTNGKSTTTAMLASILTETKTDPTVIVGSKLNKIGGNFHAGKSNNLLLEACEYRGHMLNLKPQAIILTNIEEDHLDYFSDISHILDTFQQYIDKLSSIKQVLVVNKDDLHTSQLHLPDCQVVSYGINEVADVRAINIQIQPGCQRFSVTYEGQSLGEIEIHIPGKFNVYNALAAITYSLKIGISFGQIKKSLKEFSGLWRRFEKIYDKEVTVISDYAHHPTAVKATIQAVKDFYPNKRVVAVFQPHQHDRTKKLFIDFVDSLQEADSVVVSEIFDVAGREEVCAGISSADIVKELNTTKAEQAVYAKDLDATLSIVNEAIEDGDVVIVMGAGDIYTIGDKIKLKK
ncbi:UDP-N-acetylmuramate--L-alanine ligase [Candidatus Falkowbacteria bacterium CG10_big_fil_rev_8_21_14_0_10_39_11]|uniref:UDP-N-acetylmuramate--L-alanine ligase n=1 Tax=Candidatus Falkowbacteria bacterium CG10_big_fil_rev_8_21_14_0_10_39_11 TaxID=1974565 RepID=A0A2H0V4Q6_9BACT|nr:MAG: UDP-N-acetylmuramate--L-alanine ligase [Candidatus Falkowbacteria bacterium CG10_big_fil_rev_8_21_14_0_10_39_11]